MTLLPYNLASPAAQLADGDLRAGPLTQPEYERFRDALPAWRYRLLCMVLMNTGARISEILRLEGRHCFLSGPDYYLAVRRSKQRVKDADYEPVYIRPALGTQLADYLKGSHIGAEGVVFPISRRQVARVFRATGVRALGRPVNPHMMRHLFIGALIDGGVPVTVASKLVGHSSTKTTEKWYYDLTTEKRKFIGERIQA